MKRNEVICVNWAGYLLSWAVEVGSQLSCVNHTGWALSLAMTGPTDSALGSEEATASTFHRDSLVAGPIGCL